MKIQKERIILYRKVKDNKKKKIRNKSSISEQSKKSSQHNYLCVKKKSKYVGPIKYSFYSLQKSLKKNHIIEYKCIHCSKTVRKSFRTRHNINSRHARLSSKLL